MIKRLFILFSFLFLSSISAEAQYKSTKLKMAEGLLEEGKIYAALNVYEDIVKKDGENKYVIKKIAELHKQLYSYEEAAKWYYELMEVQAGEYPKAEFEFANLTKMTGNYKLAIEHYTSFIKSYQGHDKAVLSQICKFEIKACKDAMAMLPNADYSVTRLPNNINSVFSDVAPFGFEGKLYYSSIPSDTAFAYNEFLDSAPAFQIYVAEQIEDEQFDSSKLFIPEITKTPFKHTANGAFSNDGNRFFFTQCKENVNGKMICKIFCSEKKDGKWQSAVKLGSEVNDNNNDFSSTHPTTLFYRKSKRDKKGINMLIFSSTMPGGLGGYDIWGVEIASDLTCSKPVNLGKNVNTPQNDVTPFFDASKNTLFFSSDGRGGLGGLDIFYGPVKRGKVKKTKMMDIPVNSSWDDWYYNKMSSGTAFIVSNRKESRVYHKNVRMDDIYLVKKETKKYLILSSVMNDSSKTPILGTIFKVKFANDNKSEPMEIKANSPFQIIPNKTYEIIAQKNDFINEKTLFSTSYDTKSDTIQWVFEMEKIDSSKEFVIDNIYFDFNTAKLKAKSKASLNKLFEKLIVNPGFLIEIGAHTDNKGSHEQNMELSNQRAQAVIEYLTDQGIGKERLSAKSYGETMPIAPNQNPDGSDNEEGREKNRRITFKIIGSSIVEQGNLKEDNESK